MAEIKLKKRYKYSGDIFQKLIGIGFDVETATAFLNEVEDADVVEAVRCKDCIYKTVTKDGEYNPEDIVCEYHMSDGFDSDDYCSCGKRKVDE